jgi:lipopolysaccharide export system permease protein
VCSSDLSRGQEITAMRSCGISLLWITSPFMAFATGISLVLLLFSSTVIPLAASKSEEIRTTRIEKKLPAAAVKLKQPWTRVGPDSLMEVTSISVGGDLLSSVRLFQFDPNFQLVEVTEADEARYRDSTWTLHQGRHRQFSPDGTVSTTAFDRQPIVMTLIPDDFTIWLAGDSELMTFHDIRAYSRRRVQQGSEAARLTTDYYSRIAFPFVTVVMALVGIALSLRRSGARGGSMAMGIGQALVGVVQAGQPGHRPGLQCAQPGAVRQDCTVLHPQTQERRDFRIVVKRERPIVPHGVMK